MRTRRFGNLVLVGASLVFVGAVAIVGASQGSPVPSQKTINDGVYSKAQADGAKPQFDKICANCHAFTPGMKPDKDPPLGGDKFFTKWDGKVVDELVSLISLTMPNDGSAVISDEEALNLVAYVLQQHGFPAGSQPLTRATAATAVVVKPKG